MSQAQHPKVVELLQSALDKCKKDATRSSAQSSTVQAVKAKPKSDKPSVYFAPINSYGKTTVCNLIVCACVQCSVLASTCTNLCLHAILTCWLIFG